jgi:hypothetical protein
MDEKTTGRTWHHPNRACQKQDFWKKITFNALTAMSGGQYPTMWRKVKVALSVEWAKELQKKLGKLRPDLLTRWPMVVRIFVVL